MLQILYLFTEVKNIAMRKKHSSVSLTEIDLRVTALRLHAHTTGPRCVRLWMPTHNDGEFKIEPIHDRTQRHLPWE